ncbi:MAG: hypothetical protein EOP83_05075 [Verrucomicrobiaceae bacterium]|nr:MAG: hypothetical protein EOP83_05075 [Verrucomicrobiaceae bacterium]
MTNTSLHVYPTRDPKTHYYPWVFLLLIRAHVVEQHTTHEKVRLFERNAASDAHTWCCEQFGEPERSHTEGTKIIVDRLGSWTRLDQTFYFKDQIEAAAFRLGWG